MRLGSVRSCLLPRVRARYRNGTRHRTTGTLHEYRAAQWFTPCKGPGRARTHSCARAGQICPRGRSPTWGRFSRGFIFFFIPHTTSVRTRYRGFPSVQYKMYIIPFLFTLPFPRPRAYRFARIFSSSPEAKLVFAFVKRTRRGAFGNRFANTERARTHTHARATTALCSCYLLLLLLQLVCT